MRHLNWLNADKLPRYVLSSSFFSHLRVPPFSALFSRLRHRRAAESPSGSFLQDVRAVEVSILAMLRISCFPSFLLFYDWMQFRFHEICTNERAGINAISMSHHDLLTPVAITEQARTSLESTAMLQHTKSTGGMWIVDDLFTEFRVATSLARYFYGHWIFKFVAWDNEEAEFSELTASRSKISHSGQEERVRELFPRDHVNRLVKRGRFVSGPLPKANRKGNSCGEEIRMVKTRARSISSSRHFDSRINLISASVELRHDKSHPFWYRSHFGSQTGNHFSFNAPRFPTHRVYENMKELLTENLRDLTREGNTTSFYLWNPLHI